MLSKPFFRNAVKRKRCLIPTSGWYEWKEIAPKQKQPYFIRPASAEVFAFAGLYEESEEEPGYNFAIVVGDAAPETRTLHLRQPMVIRQGDYDGWLNPETSQNALEAMLQYRESDYDRKPVSKLVNNPRNDASEIFDKLL